jgi:hypothetical protein
MVSVDAAVDVDWDKDGVHSIDVKLLVLSDRLRDCYSNHLRIYLDQNQTIGELELRRRSVCLVFLDCMMKLRAKMFKSDSSTFHLLMNKGLSVHVFTVKERLHKGSMALAWRNTSATLKSETPRSNTTQVRGYMAIWLDSFFFEHYASLRLHDDLARQFLFEHYASPRLLDDLA